METKTYTTKPRLIIPGYTYKYIPADVELDEETMDLLEDAMAYHRVVVIPVSDSHFQHLYKELQITPCYPDKADNDEYTFIYKMRQGTITFSNPNNHYRDLVLWADEEEPNTIEYILFQDVFQHDLHYRGLWHLLDKNYGGALNKRNRSIASLIIYG